MTRQEIVRPEEDGGPRVRPPFGRLRQDPLGQGLREEEGRRLRDRKVRHFFLLAQTQEAMIMKLSTKLALKT